MPLGGCNVSFFLSKTCSPLKHNESLSKFPPNASQKSDFDCHKSVNKEEFEFWLSPALVFKDGAKGEFVIGMFWQESQTDEQKLFSDVAVELQRTGTGLGLDFTLNNSAEN